MKNVESSVTLRHFYYSPYERDDKLPVARRILSHVSSSKPSRLSITTIGLEKAIDLQHRDEMTNLCITIFETRPVFYIVLVTTTLSTVIIARYPKETTHVTKCVVSPQRLDVGLRAPNSRGNF
ncbi:hypothetical protein BJV78DRAFT_1226034 [Lactifluus subvellereus]|nr:hypothetical protein BJV78DRAFT_1226034 [Lactifluus subvellereus]